MGRIKMVLTIFLAAAFIFIGSSRSHAIPELQLDVAGGYYDYSTETIVASDNAFTLFAYLIPESLINDVSGYYYISAAISPKTGPADSNLGIFKFNNQTIRVTEDMTYGVPPLEAICTLYPEKCATQNFDSGDLEKHSVFPTFFSEFRFQFAEENLISQYNTQDRAKSDDSIDLASYDGPLSMRKFNGMYFAAFTVDISGLDPEYTLHFDLYNTTIKTKRITDIDINEFAPFSHDAESGHSTLPAPEPSTLILLGAGLAGISLFARKKRK